MKMNKARTLPSEAVRQALRTKREIALIDVREEEPFAHGHPLFAAQLSASRIELDAPWRLPRRDVPIAVYDDGEVRLARRHTARIGNDLIPIWAYFHPPRLHTELTCEVRTAPRRRLRH